MKDLICYNIFYLHLKLFFYIYRLCTLLTRMPVYLSECFTVRKLLNKLTCFVVWKLKHIPYSQTLNTDQLAKEKLKAGKAKDFLCIYF